MDVRLTGGYVRISIFLRHSDPCALPVRCAPAAACVDTTVGRNLLRHQLRGVAVKSSWILQRPCPF